MLSTKVSLQNGKDKCFYLLSYVNLSYGIVKVKLFSNNSQSYSNNRILYLLLYGIEEL
jgi:hypothetical protein